MKALCEIMIMQIFQKNNVTSDYYFGPYLPGQDHFFSFSEGVKPGWFLTSSSHFSMYPIKSSSGHYVRLLFITFLLLAVHHMKNSKGL